MGTQTDMGTQNNDDRLRAMHREVMQGLNESTSFEDGVRAVLQSVGTTLGWAGGEYWEVGNDHSTLTRLALWCTPGDQPGGPTGDQPGDQPSGPTDEPADGPAVGPLVGPLVGPERISLPIATGLPGAVWANDSEIWTGDIAAEPGDPIRADQARDAGLNMAVTVPVTTKDHPGVLLFFARDRVETPAVLLFALQSIGAHVGQFVERCRSNEDLHEERRRLREAQRIARVGSWEWNTDNDTVDWSDIMFELYGVDPEKFTADQANRRSIHPDDLGAVEQAFRQCLAKSEPLVWRYRVIRMLDGEVRTFEARGEVMPAEAGRHARVVGTAMDVTEQVRIQQESVAREEMLRSILANSQSLIYVKDLDGRYLMTNEPLLRARSISEADLLGNDDTVLDPVMAPVWRANDLRAQQGEFSVEEWFDTPDGRIYYETVKFPLLDAAGQPFAIGGISLDVTAQRQAAEAMAEARDAAMAANAAKTSFLATMSHEIRTPMNAVIGMTDLLLETTLDTRQQEYMHTIRTSGDALLAVINDILDFSRIEAGEMELEDRPFELRRCVEDSLALVAGTATGLDLVSHIDQNCPRFLVGDVNRLRQVLVNLLGNAIKFTQQGDVLITVTAAAAGSPDSSEADGFVLSFSVRDTGIGIPEERMDRLFRSFSQVDTSTTRMYGGSGLGLAISRAIVQSMGGDIEVTSTVGVGSEFSFAIRLARCLDPPAELVDPHGSGEGVDLSGRRVLVVDDNDTNRRILRIQLETWGMSCTAVASPRGALAVLDEGPGFDIAILDMHMPETDGMQLAAQIRRLPIGEHLPLVLLTSLATKPQESPEELFAGFHTKPIRAGALRLMLGQILTPRRPGTELPTVNEALPAPASLRVLLAEDNVVNQMVAQRLLHRLGHFVDIAGDGHEALDAVLKTDYDVVLMDIHMPNMDGLDATRAIRSLIPAPRQPQIVAMTASSLPEDRRACAEAGMNGYLLKPVRMADLVESLHALPIDAPRPPSTPALVPTAAAVDLDVLTQLTADMGATSLESRLSLIEAYLEQADAWIPELITAGRDGDTERVRTIAHTLGSSSALLGAQPLADLLAETGRLARAGHDDLVPSVTAVANEYRMVSMVLRANHDALSVTEVNEAAAVNGLTGEIV